MRPIPLTQSIIIGYPGHNIYMPVTVSLSSLELMITQITVGRPTHEDGEKDEIKF